MKRILTTTITLSLIALTFFAGTLPQGWYPGGNAAGHYDMGMDKTVAKTGTTSGYIASKHAHIKGFGSMIQSCNAQKYLGKKVMMTGFIKTSDVKGWAGMMMRVDANHLEDHSLSFDNMQYRKKQITGTMDWTECKIVLYVPEISESITYGFLLNGTGKIWFDDIKLEIVPDETKTTAMWERIEAPENTDFEK